MHNKTPFVFLIIILLSGTSFVSATISSWHNVPVYNPNLSLDNKRIIENGSHSNVVQISKSYSYLKWDHPLRYDEIKVKLSEAKGRAIISFFNFDERNQAVHLLSNYGIDILNILNSIPAVEISYTNQDQFNLLSLSSFHIKYISPLGRVSFRIPIKQNIGETLKGQIKLSEIRRILQIDDIQNTKDANGEYIFGNNITVAIMDSGIESASFACLRKKAVYLGNGDIRLTNEEKIIYSFSAVPGEDINDLSGHGTDVASILAGNGFYFENGKEQYTGEYGIAPGVSIMNIKVLNATGEGKDEWLIDGLDKAMVNEKGVQADIVSASLTSITFKQIGDPLEELVSEAAKRNIIIVTSAGNYGPSGSTVGSPAIWPNVLSIGSTSSLKDISIFSSSGPTPDFTPGIDVLAPGRSVLGLNITNGEERYLSGTSISAPIVSGVIALLRQAFPSKNTSEIENAVLATAIDIHKPIVLQGNGVIDPYSAYSLLNSTKGLTFAISPKRISKENYLYYASVIATTTTFHIKAIASDQQYLRSIVVGDTDIVQIANTIKLEKGWNIFTFNISINSNSVLRNYHAVIIFQNGDLFQQKMIIDIQSRYYNGKILFDLSHDEEKTNNSWFASSGPYGAHLYLARLLQDRGYEITTFLDGNLSAALSQNVDILVISDPELEFDQSELDTITSFVNAGGSLLILINSYRLNTEDLKNDPIFPSNYTVVNQLLNIIGLKVDPNIEETAVPYLAEFNPHLTDITSTSKAIFWGSCLQFISNSSSNAVNSILARVNVGDSSNSLFKTVAVATEMGKGRVLTFGSGYPFTTLGLLHDSYDIGYEARSIIGLDSRDYDSIFNSEIDKLDSQLANDTFYWLSQFNRPSISYSINKDQILIRQPFTLTVTIKQSVGMETNNPYAKTSIQGTILFVNNSFKNVVLHAVDAGVYSISITFSEYGLHTIFIPLNISGHRPTDGRIDLFCNVDLWDKQDLMTTIGTWTIVGFAVIATTVPLLRYRFKNESKTKELTK